MQKTLSTLIELQEIDNRLDELREERGDLPDIVEGLRAKYSNKERTKNSLEETVEEMQKRSSELNRLIQEAKDKLAEENERLYQVKTNKEYDAITVEIETLQSNLTSYEKEVTTLSVSIDEKMTELTKIDTELAEIKKELDENEDELKERLSETEVEEKELLKSREAIVKDFDEEILADYEIVREARSGQGVAIVQDGHCGGCYSYIPPQKVVEIRKQKKIYTCEFCGRILVWEDK
ncbi:MAG: hypothetical protein D6677_05615 [Calditrichaeota bacterium]|nr:MAG: hypothetical protein D6677_05615 [Calditrichota bacterium]